MYHVSNTCQEVKLHANVQAQPLRNGSLNSNMMLIATG